MNDDYTKHSFSGLDRMEGIKHLHNKHFNEDSIEKNNSNNIIPTPLPPSSDPPGEYLLPPPIPSSEKPFHSSELSKDAHVPKTAKLVHEQSEGEKPMRWLIENCRDIAKGWVTEEQPDNREHMNHRGESLAGSENILAIEPEKKIDERKRSYNIEPPSLDWDSFAPQPSEDLHRFLAYTFSLWGSHK